QTQSFAASIIPRTTYGQQIVPPTLLPEILGFSPQLLLDDIVNAAQQSIFDCIDGLDAIATQWGQNWKKRTGEDVAQEFEQGIVTFQTLLESHTDLAFDFFETWSLRNIFSFPEGLPIVVPHQKGLDLNEPAEEEVELLAEIEELRQQITNQRKLKRMYTKAVRISATNLRRSEERVKRLDYLANPSTKDLLSLPEQVLQLYESVSSLPHIDPTASAAATSRLPDPGRRQWETNKTGYVNWAVGQLVAKSKEQGSGGGSTAVGNAVEQAYSVGEVGEVKGALSALEGTREGDDDEDMDMDADT
ncbi:Mis12-domain-containing protein, partial [Rickenella mellea]